MTASPVAGFSMDDEKFAFLLNDLVAASWVERELKLTEPSDLEDRFLQLHRSFMVRLGRTDKGIFDTMDREYLSEIVQGWLLLYSNTLSDLRKRFPRRVGNSDLLAKGVNWSQRLGISLSGLIRVDNASRYAEFWAERSFNQPEFFESFSERVDFVGSREYVEYSDMINSGALLILDERLNGIPSFDVFSLIRRKRIKTRGELSLVFEEQGWSFSVCSNAADYRLLTLGNIGLER